MHKAPTGILFILDYEHVGVGYSFDSASFTKENLGCYHNTDTYLHWLANSVALADESRLPE